MVGSDPRIEALRESWEENAVGWARAVREDLIASRREVTNQAILDAIRDIDPRRVLDVGCGEGWLTRELGKRDGCDVLGIDGSLELVELAREHDPSGRYVHLTYEAFAADPEALDWRGELAVCNFAILSEDSVPLLAAVRSRLSSGGHLIIQTLHSWSAAGPEGYRDGWRDDDFSKLPGDGWAPMTWYFRTLESWVRDINAAGYSLAEMREPRKPDSDELVSLIFICRSD